MARPLDVEDAAVGVVNAIATAIAGGGNIPDAGHGVDFIIRSPLVFHEDGQLRLWVNKPNSLILTERVLHFDSPSLRFGVHLLSEDFPDLVEVRHFDVNPDGFSIGMGDELGLFET